MKKKAKARAAACPGNSGQLSICRTATQLAELYSTEPQDRPENVLGAYPQAARVIEALTVLIDVMLPGRMSAGPADKDELDIFLVRRLSETWHMLLPEIRRAVPFRWLGSAAQTEGHKAPQDIERESLQVVTEFFGRLPAIRALLIEDIRAAYDGDPAALTFAEIKVGYPGLLAITSHRLAHELYALNVPVIPRVMSEWTHSQTGIDIHPGARIGRGFFIDHGTGVVIGETSVIGDRVKIYQGVTLGARSFPVDEHGIPIKHIQRHPTVANDVVIYANATILGGDTVIGAGSTIGGNVFLMESVPPDSFVAYKHPELRIKPVEKK